MRVLAEAGLMRDEGEGIPRIFEEMEESFLRAPSFDLADGVFTVTLHNEPIFTGPSQEWQELVKALPATLAHKKVLLAHPEGFTNEDYRKLNQMDRDEAYRQIQELVTAGVLHSSGKAGRGATYRVSGNLRHARAFLEERLPVLRAFFETHSELQNADYRRLFELSRHVATRELRRIADGGFLRSDGRGRGAHYVPRSALGGREQ